jgi:hypothetical protein
LTIEYLKYGTKVNIVTGYEYKMLPAISFCVTSKRQLSEINMNEKSFETSADFLYGSIYFGSGYLYEGKYIENEFDNISHVIESVTLFAYKCVTYLSDIVVNRHLILANKSFAFSIFNALKLSLILHSPRIPPHLFNEIKNINTSL